MQVTSTNGSSAGGFKSHAKRNKEQAPGNRMLD